jgi:predicted nucleic acid-binding protein
VIEQFPAGESIFLDANVLLYHALEARPSCALLLRRSQKREIRTLTSTVVLSEVSHHLILAEAVQRFTLPSTRAALNLPRRHPHHLATFTLARQFMAQIPALRIRILPLRWRELVLAGELSQRYHLLMTDALILATMRRFRLIHLATNDQDFRRVQDITLWLP